MFTDKNIAAIGVLIVILIGSIGWMVGQRNDSLVSESQEPLASVALYKSPYCGCCGMWGNYMEDNHYEVVTILEEDMSIVKEQFKVPYELESCHTSLIDGYVIEGHVPKEAIERLLNERPDIRGIGMAGMPSGSPGMPGPKAEFLIYEILHDGTRGDLFMTL